MTIEIKSIAGAILYSAEVDTLRNADLRDARLRDANLYGVDLRDADLRYADLRSARLRGANLLRANLYGTNLYCADLRGANLYGVDLRDANLRDANLRDANLRDASLDGANFCGADLIGVDISGANLFRARGVPVGIDYLKPVREDLRKILDAAPNEVPGLLAALWAGTVDGAHYEGECTCLVGTIAHLRHEHYTSLTLDLLPDGSRPAERWFLQISKGDTPLTNTSAAYVAAVIAQWFLDRAKVMT